MIEQSPESAVTRLVTLDYVLLLLLLQDYYYNYYYYYYY